MFLIRAFKTVNDLAEPELQFPEPLLDVGAVAANDLTLLSVVVNDLVQLGVVSGSTFLAFPRFSGFQVILFVLTRLGYFPFFIKELAADNDAASFRLAIGFILPICPPHDQFIGKGGRQETAEIEIALFVSTAGTVRLFNCRMIE